MNMDEKVRYPGAQSIYDHLQIKGPLGDRKIAQYVRQGVYGKKQQALQAFYDLTRKPRILRSKVILKELLS